MATSSERTKTYRLKGEDAITKEILIEVAKYAVPDKLTSLAIGELKLTDPQYKRIVAPNTHWKEDQAYEVSKNIHKIPLNTNTMRDKYSGWVLAGRGYHWSSSELTERHRKSSSLDTIQNKLDYCPIQENTTCRALVSHKTPSS